MIQKKLFLLFSFILLIIGTVSAQEDFTFTVPENLDLCPCSNQAYPITIHNIGTETSTYTIYATGQAAEWVTFQPSTLTLNPNEITQVFAFVNSVCNIVGNSSLNLFVQTENGFTRGLSQVLTFNDCYDYSVTFGQEVAEADGALDFATQEDDYVLCQGQELVVPLLIENKEQFTNRFQLFLDAPEWAILETTQAQLAEESQAVAVISVNTAEVQGEFEFKISAISELGKVERKIEKDVIVDDCLAFEVDILEDEVAVCEGSTEIIDLIIRNGAAISQDVELEVDGTARIQNESFIVDPKDQVETKLFLFSTEGLDYDLTVTANVETIDAVYTDTVAVSVVEAETCYQADISVKKRITNRYTQEVYSARVTNNGQNKVTYQVSLEGADWASVVPRTLDLEKGEEGNLNVAINPPEDVAPGEYELTLSVESNSQTYEETITVSVKESGLLGSVAATFSYYQYYLYTAIIILILIVVVIYFVKRMLHKNDEYDEVEEKPKKVESKKPSKKEVKKTTEKKKNVSKKKTSKSSEQTISKKVWILAFVGIVFLIGVLVVSLVDALQPVRDLFSLYLVYILIGIGVLVVIILLLRYTPLSKLMK